MKPLTQALATKEYEILAHVTEASTFILVIPEEDAKSLWKENAEGICKGASGVNGLDQLVFDFPRTQLLMEETKIEVQQWPVTTTFHVLPEGNEIGVIINDQPAILNLSPEIPNLQPLLKAIKKRNLLAQISIPESLRKQFTKNTQHSKSQQPKRLRQATFVEVRALSQAISDAPTRSSYLEIEGEMALLHEPKFKGRKSPLGTRFQPTPELWNWWGLNPTKEALREALGNLNFETNMTFQVTLARLLQTEHARHTFDIDEIIKLIGRDTDARRSGEARQKLRREVWGNLLTLASMPVVGARNGVWREPGVKGEKRAAISKEKLISRDPLLVVTGTGITPNDKEPPKKVSLTAGEWLMPWVGNREVLSDFGDVLKLAQIPRGKVSGAWAACIGLALQQKWREEAHKAEKNWVSRGQGAQIEVLKFRPFTRRELLTEMFKCDDRNSPNTILSDPEGRRPRAQAYWKSAVRELKALGFIGHYREMTPLEDVKASDLNSAWLDQPLDIRPSDEYLKDALEIHKRALELKKRARRSGVKAPTKKPVHEPELPF